jgi:hypothetical protein
LFASFVIALHFAASLPTCSFLLKAVTHEPMARYFVRGCPAFS